MEVPETGHTINQLDTLHVKQTRTRHDFRFQQQKGHIRNKRERVRILGMSSTNITITLGAPWLAPKRIKPPSAPGLWLLLLAIEGQTPIGVAIPASILVRDGEHSYVTASKAFCVREAPDCLPRNAMNEDQYSLRIGHCAFHQNRIMMKWTGPGCRGRNGKVLQDGGCQCAKYCGYKCKAACNSDPYNMCAWNATRGVCTYKDGGADGYSMAVCPPIVNRGPGAEGGFTLFGANQGA